MPDSFKRLVPGAFYVSFIGSISPSCLSVQRGLAAHGHPQRVLQAGGGTLLRVGCHQLGQRVHGAGAYTRPLSSST